MTLEPELYYSAILLCITIMHYVIMHYVNHLSCDLILLPCCPDLCIEFAEYCICNNLAPSYLISTGYGPRHNCLNVL